MWFWASSLISLNLKLLISWQYLPFRGFLKINITLLKHLTQCSPHCRHSSSGLWWLILLALRSYRKKMTKKRMFAELFNCWNDPWEKIFLVFIYFWESASRWRSEREREGPKWALCWQQIVGLELMSGEIMTWAKVGCLTNWATQAPQESKTFTWGRSKLWAK